MKLNLYRVHADLGNRMGIWDVQAKDTDGAIEAAQDVAGLVLDVREVELVEEGTDG